MQGAPAKYLHAKHQSQQRAQRAWGRQQAKVPDSQRLPRQTSVPSSPLSMCSYPSTQDSRCFVGTEQIKRAPSTQMILLSCVDGSCALPAKLFDLEDYAGSETLDAQGCQLKILSEFPSALVLYSFVRHADACFCSSVGQSEGLLILRSSVRARSEARITFDFWNPEVSFLVQIGPCQVFD